MFEKCRTPLVLLALAFSLAGCTPRGPRIVHVAIVVPETSAEEVDASVADPLLKALNGLAYLTTAETHSFGDLVDVYLTFERKIDPNIVRESVTKSLTNISRDAKVMDIEPLEAGAEILPPNSVLLPGEKREAVVVRDFSGRR